MYTYALLGQELFAWRFGYGGDHCKDMVKDDSRTDVSSPAVFLNFDSTAYALLLLIQCLILANWPYACANCGAIPSMI